MKNIQAVKIHTNFCHHRTHGFKAVLLQCESQVTHLTRHSSFTCTNSPSLQMGGDTTTTSLAKIPHSLTNSTIPLNHYYTYLLSMAQDPLSQALACANCGAPSSKSCGGCGDATHYVKEAAKTFYCTSECQKMGWKAHITTCEDLRQQVRLHQVGELLRKVWLVFREQTYHTNIDRVEVQGKNISIFETLREPLGYPEAFPQHLFRIRRSRNLFWTSWPLVKPDPV